MSQDKSTMNKLKAKVIAFYLPQYHPIKENNEWYGEGFTEWTNVGKATPQFRGHYQPRIPADLGYYDLRLPEVRIKQAELAKEAGISAFCYYHYWFGNGRELMEMPLNEVIRTGSPDFPFCICWANHSFYKKEWNPNIRELKQELLLEQTYPGDEDIIAHFETLLPAFLDKRYYRIENRLAFVIYNAKDIPDFLRFKQLWNQLAIKNHLPEFFFISYTTIIDEVNSTPFNEYDAVILSLINNTVLKGKQSIFSRKIMAAQNKIGRLLHRPLMVRRYADVLEFLTDPIEKQKEIIPVLVPNWDLTPRRGSGGLILHESTPVLFKKHVTNALEIIKNKPIERQILFLKSWNEWGEGNYMEPDIRFGKGYIKVLRELLVEE